MHTLAIIIPLVLAAPEADAYLGSWDIQIIDPAAVFNACWWKVEKTGGGLQATVLWRWASPERAKSVEVTSDGIRVVKDEGGKDLVVTARAEDGKLRGTVRYPDGKSLPIEGRPVPELDRRAARWGKPVELFDGKTLNGWKVRSVKPKEPGWSVKDGELVCRPQPENDLCTERTFQDFKLHVEYQAPKGSNSGIYIRGRYEVQIEGDHGKRPDVHSTGAIYGRIPPAENATRPDDEWQAYDIELVGRTVTVALNGKTVIERKRIEGITGGAFPDAWEAERGPIMIQGDHGVVRVRKVTITPAE